MMPFHGRFWFGADAGQTRVQSREWWKLKDRLGTKSDSRYCRGDERGTSRKDSLRKTVSPLSQLGNASVWTRKIPVLCQKPAMLWKETSPLCYFWKRKTSSISVTLLTGVKHYFKRRRLHTSDLSAPTVIGSFFCFFVVFFVLNPRNSRTHSRFLVQRGASLTGNWDFKHRQRAPSILFQFTFEREDVNCLDSWVYFYLCLMQVQKLHIGRQGYVIASKVRCWVVKSHVADCV